MNPQQLVHERLAQQNSWGLLGTQGYILGLDLGSYGQRAALIDLQSRQFASLQHASVEGDPEQVVSAAIELGQTLLKQHNVAVGHLVRVGVGFGGPVDIRRGTVIRSPRRSDWDQYPLQMRFETAFDTTTLVDNDANLIALAEATFGAGRDVEHLFYLHLSSGVGGGMVLDGRLYHGATMTAGEVGHAVVGPDGERPQTLEQLVSVPALLARAAKLGLPTNDLADLFKNTTVGWQVLDEAVEVLAVRLSQISALLDPQLIVLGGILVRIGGDDLLQRIRRRLSTYLAVGLVQEVPVQASVLGPDSVAIGALARALESLRE